VDPVVVVDDPNFAVGRAGDLLVVLWIGETTPSAVRRIAELVRTSRDRGERIGLLQVILHAAKPPDQETREALIELVRGGRDVLAASAVVYPGDGFIMAAARAFVSGIAMLARPGFPHMVFPSRTEAADWIARLLPAGRGQLRSGAEVSMVIDALVRRVGATDL
jgi:hypothetical protein